MNDLLNLPLTAFLALVIGFGFIIFVHELGHFLVAKWVGIKVTQFAIGFGPSIVAWRKGIGFRPGSTEAEYEARLEAGADPASMSETEYRLNYLPLGGYVKMLGQEDLDPAARSNDPRSFNAKPIWARAAVISAGVVMNLIFGLIFLIVAFMSGVAFPPPVVGGVIPGTPAATTYAVGHEGDPDYRGLSVGDQITHIDGDPIQDMIEVKIATALGRAGDPLELTVRPWDEPDRTLRYVMTPRPDERDGMLSIGILPPSSDRVALVVRDSVAAEEGVRPGMEVARVGDEPVESFAGFYHTLAAARGEAVPVTFVDPETQQEVTVPLSAQPLLVQSDDRPANLAGLVPLVRVEQVLEGSPAEALDVQAGDVVAEVDGEPWPHQTQFLNLVATAAEANRPLSVTVWREGELVDLGATRLGRDGRLGVGLGIVTDEPIVGRTLPDSPAAALDLVPGSRIVSMGGEPVEDWGDMQRILGSLPTDAGRVEVPVSYELNLADAPRGEGVLALDEAQVEVLAAAGWTVPPVVGFDVLRVRLAGDNPWAATKLGLEKTGQFMLQTYVALLRLFEGSVKIYHLRGPVGIVDEGTRIAEEGWEYLLFFLGIISVNLVVINFLPIPIVDGGHILFLIIEKLKGSPVSARVQIAATYVGLALIALVFLATLYYDVSRWITGP